MKLLIATNNQGKVGEYLHILRAALPGVALVTLREAGIEHEVDETGDSFEANARLKAESYARLSGMAVIADDSGLEVAALDGFPGIHSARWTGPGDEERRQGLLARLKGVPAEQRGARFVCVTVCRAPDGGEAVARGEVAGRIGWEARGGGGFGYDPIFVLDDGRTLAELSSDEKNAISHRGRAAQALIPQLGELLDGMERG